MYKFFKNIITANSTYSWWIDWLNNNNYKKIFYAYLLIKNPLIEILSHYYQIILKKLIR